MNKMDVDIKTVLKYRAEKRVPGHRPMINNSTEDGFFNDDVFGLCYWYVDGNGSTGVVVAGRMAIRNN